MYIRDGSRWERRHANGWVATVSIVPSHDYTCFIYPELAYQHSAWALQGIDDLTLAQQLADERVPPHHCSCPPWSAA